MFRHGLRAIYFTGFTLLVTSVFAAHAPRHYGSLTLPPLPSTASPSDEPGPDDLFLVRAVGPLQQQVRQAAAHLSGVTPISTASAQDSAVQDREMELMEALEKFSARARSAGGDAAAVSVKIDNAKERLAKASTPQEQLEAMRDIDALLSDLRAATGQDYEEPVYPD